MNSRADLILVATRVFAEKGYNGASLRDIAQAAGILRGSVYHHVSSKEELLLEGLLPALEEATVQVEAVVNGALAGEGHDFADALRKAVQTHLHCLYGNESLEGVKIYLTENLLAAHSELSEQAKASLRTLTKRHESNFTRLFRAAIAAGQFRQDVDPKLHAYLLLGMCNWLSRWYRPEGAWSLEQIADAIAGVTLHGCLAETRRRVS